MMMHWKMQLKLQATGVGPGFIKRGFCWRTGDYRFGRPILSNAMLPNNLLLMSVQLANCRFQFLKLLARLAKFTLRCQMLIVFKIFARLCDQSVDVR
jgi:hypothetical protein